MRLRNGGESGEWIHLRRGDTLHPCVALHYGLADGIGFGLLQRRRCDSSCPFAVSKRGHRADLLGARRRLQIETAFTWDFNPTTHGGPHTCVDFCRVVAICLPAKSKEILTAGLLKGCCRLGMRVHVDRKGVSVAEIICL